MCHRGHGRPQGVRINQRIGVSVLQTTELAHSRCLSELGSPHSKYKVCFVSADDAGIASQAAAGVRGGARRGLFLPAAVALAPWPFPYRGVISGI